MTPAEIYYIVNCGIKMLGMPALGPLLSDETLWGVVVGVQLLPDLGHGVRQGTDDKHDHSL